ncbi:MAG: hypothetical protein MUF71_03410 [Candidatus Kapabacteria bacterium]|jgi:uncharacterized membrane protein|nr:hypothetical protein [Candidatus Kapabacteria bacterium]
MKTLRQFFVRIVPVAFLGLAFLQSIAFACPNCKDNFDLNSTQGGIGAAYGYTIYFMILLPVVIIVTLVIKVKRQMDANDKTHLYREIGDTTAEA